MRFSSTESIRALHYAADREIESREHYEKCLASASSPGAKEIFRGLVDDERRHFEMVARLLTEADAGKKTPTMETIRSEAAKVRVERSFPNLSATAPNFSADTATIHEILQHALALEKESFDNYSHAAEESEELEIKAVYRFFAGEENIHYVLVDNLLDFLDAPGRWLYEEENLIFRR